MKCILDLESAINLRIEVAEHNVDHVKLSIKDNYNESVVHLKPHQAEDLAEMLKQIALQVEINKF